MNDVGLVLMRAVDSKIIEDNEKQFVNELFQGMGVYFGAKEGESSSRDKSERLFNLIIKFNSDVKKKTSSTEIKIGKIFKTLYNQDTSPIQKSNLFLYELVINQNFDNNFDHKSKCDWHRFFRFSNRIQISIVDIESPITRNIIRQMNRNLANKYNIYNQIDKDKDMTNSIDIMLTLLQLGLYKLTDKKEFLEYFLTDMKEKFKKLRVYLDTKFDRPTLNYKSNSPSPNKLKARRSTMKLDEPASLKFKLTDDLNMLLTYMKILNHLIILSNDEFNIDIKDKNAKFFYEDTKLLSIAKVVVDNLDSIISLKELVNLDLKNTSNDNQFDLQGQRSVIRDLMMDTNRLIIMLMHPVKDYYYLSIKKLENEKETVKDLNKMSEFGSYLKGLPSDYREIMIKLEEMITQLMENYYLLETYKYSNDLKSKLDKLLEEVSNKVKEYISFREYFCLGNGIYYIMVLMHIISGYYKENDNSIDIDTSNIKHYPSNTSMQTGLEIISQLFIDNPFACSQLFKKRPINMFKRVMWIDTRCAGLVLLCATINSLDEIQSSQIISEIMLKMYLDILMEFFNENHLEKKKNDSFDKSRIVGLIVFTKAMKNIVLYSTDKYFRQKMQLKIQDGIGEIVKEYSLVDIIDEKSWKNDSSDEIDISSFIEASYTDKFKELAEGVAWKSMKTRGLVLQLNYFVLSLLNDCILDIESSKAKIWISSIFKEGNNKIYHVDGKKFEVLFTHEFGLYYFMEIIRLYTNTVALEKGPFDRSLIASSMIENRRKSATTIDQQKIERKMEKENDNYKLHLENGKKEVDIKPECTLIFKGLLRDITELFALVLKHSAGRFKDSTREVNKRFMYKGLLRLIKKFLRGAEYENENIDWNHIHCDSLRLTFIDRKEFILDMCHITKDNRIKFNPVSIKGLDSSSRWKNDENQNLNENLQAISSNLFEIRAISEIIDALYDENLEFEIQIKNYTRESPADLQKKPSVILDDMNDLGCLDIIKLKKKIDEEAMRMINNRDKQDILKESTSGRVEERKKTHKYTKEGRIDKLIASYKNSKKSAMQYDEENNNKSEVLKQFDEGNIFTQTSYDFIIDWIMTYIKYSKENEPTDSQEDFAAILIKDSTVIEFITIFSNLLSVRPIARGIFYDLYFHPQPNKPETTKVEDNRTDDQDKGNFNLETNSFIISEEEQQKSQVMKGERFLELLIRSALMLQKTVKNSIFTYDISMTLERYFLVCLTLKEIVEGNQMTHLKYIVGKKLIPQYEPIAELYKGLIFDYDKEVEGVITAKDRADLVWYNIVTLWTLTEYITGPCVENQVGIVNDFNMIFKVLNRINPEPFSIYFYLQDALIVFLSSLFEQSNRSMEKRETKENKDNIKLVTDYVEPDLFFSIINGHINNLFINRVIMKDKTYDFAVLKEKDDLQAWKLTEYYKKFEKFSNHPSVSISVKLYFIMMSLKNKSQKYKKYIEKHISKEDSLIESSQRSEDRKQHLPISQNNSSQQNHHKLTAEVQRGIFRFIAQITSTVEILVNSNDEKQKRIEMYIQKMPETLYITEKYKEQFLNECSFKDANSKLTDLMSFASAYHIEMQYFKKLYTKYPQLAVFGVEDAYLWYKIILWTCGFVLNILLLTSLDLTDGNPEIKTLGMFAAIETLNIAIFCLAVASFVIWILLKYPVNLKVQESIMKNDFETEFEARKYKRWFYKYIFNSLLKELPPMAFLLHIFASIGTFFISYIFIGVHLLSIMFISKTTRYVIKSITQHYDQLLTTFLLTIITIYCFSFIILQVFHDNFSDSGTEEDLNRCETLASCFFSVIDFGLRSGGGIGDTMKPIQQQDSIFYPKIVLDLLFFILINLVSLNIVFGIILDTFAELRDDQQERGRKD